MLLENCSMGVNLINNDPYRTYNLLMMFIKLKTSMHIRSFKQFFAWKKTSNRSWIKQILLIQVLLRKINTDLISIR